MCSCSQSACPGPLVRENKRAPSAGRVGEPLLSFGVLVCACLRLKFEMDKWGHMYETDVQSQLQSPHRPCRTHGGGVFRHLGKSRRGWNPPKMWAVVASKSRAASRKGLGHRSPLGHRLSPPPCVPLLNAVKRGFSHPSMNALLLPSWYTQASSLATKLFINVIAMNSESRGFKLVILHCVSQKA